MHGLGIDVIEIERIEQAVGRWGRRFLARVFTDQEIAYCLARGRPGQSFAARFAAKEAFAKAVEPHVRPTWLEVEVAIGDDRKPRLELAPRLEEIVGKRRIRVSLSHSQTVAVAAVVID
jgi:holo-[acyl-carrier protein] synthase